MQEEIPMKKLILLSLLILFASVGLVQGAEQHIGKVKGTKGLVSIIRAGKNIPAFPHMKLYINDTIMTGSNGAVGVLLEDNTLLSMGPMSRLAMDKFEFKPSENKYAMKLRMQQGTFVYLSGLLGKLAPLAVELNTPVGTISMLKESNFMATFPAREQ